MLIGICIGLYLKYFYFEEGFERLTHLGPQTYFLFLIPPILYQVGFSMNAPTFFRNLSVINTFAIGATIISSLVFGTIIYYCLKFTSLDFNYIECFQLGCILSAIDPVATMSIFKNLQMNERIYMYVYGESTLNNAVVIAM